MNTVDKVYNYIGAATTSIGGLLLLMVKSIEYAVEKEAKEAPDGANMIYVASAANSGLSMTNSSWYYFNKYVQLPKNQWPLKWFEGYVPLVTGLVALFLLIKKESNSEIFSKVLSKGIAPTASIGAAIYTIWTLIDNQKMSHSDAYIVLHILDGFASSFDLWFVDEILMDQPEAYFTIHGIRGLSAVAEGASLVIDTIEG